MALLIGNATYKTGQAKAGEARFNGLSNPCNDVTAIEAKLVLLGWNSKDIVRICDADTASMMTELRTFVQKFQYSERPLGVLYFAGHGLQVNDKNYLFGVDAAPNLNDAAQLLARNSRATLFLKDSVDLNSLVYNSVGRITEGALLVVLDACRENPLLDIILKRNIAVRVSAPRPVGTPPGIVTEFSTSDGATAADGVGANSPFAAALLKYLRADTRVDDILAETGTQVAEDTNDKQIPQKTGYFAQRNGLFWCFHGCAATDQAIRYGRGTYGPLRVASLSPEGPSRDNRRPSVTRLADATDAPAAGTAPSNTPSDNADKEPDQKPNAPVRKQTTQLIFARPVSSLPKPDLVTPLNVDIFYCLGDGVAERQTISQELASAVASIAVKDPVKSLTAISQVRLRAINPDPSLVPAPALNSNILLFDSTDPGSRAFSSSIAKGSTVELTPVSQREQTPGYMSIFICSNTAVTRPPGQIFFQIPSRDEEPIARRSIESLKHALPDVSVSDSLAVQPDKSPAATEVHYYFEKDKEAAKVLADALSNMWNVQIVAKFVNRISTALGGSNQIQSGSFEVSLGKNLSKNLPENTSKTTFWTSKDAARDATNIQSQVRQFKCGLPGLC